MVRKRPDAKAKGRDGKDETAMKQYKKLLLLRSDAKLALTEGVALLRAKALEVAKVPEVDREEMARVGAEDMVRIKKVENQRVKALGAMRRETRKQAYANRGGEEASAYDNFQVLLREVELYSKSNDDGTAKMTPVKATPVKASPVARSSSKLDDSDDETFTAHHSFVDNADLSYLGGKLRPYQVGGVKWLVGLHDKCLSGILADEMGLGKTFQTIALLSYLKYTLKVPGPHLVLCPRSVLGNWNRECAKWSPGLKVLVYHAVKDERKAMNAQLKDTDADVILSTWEQVALGMNVFKKMSFRYLILDEGHKIKNDESITAQNVRKLRCTNRLLLTGTPLQNNLMELWALLNFLLPRLFQDKSSFDDWFDAASGNSETKVMDQLHLILRPFMLRRIKTEADAGIPPKKEVYISCQLSKLQRKWYQNILAKDADSFDTDRSGVVIKNLRNIVMHLRKVCNHPFLFDGVEDGPPFVTDEKIIKASGKMIILDKLLAKLFAEPVETRQKVLIFSQMTRVLDILADYLEWRGWKFCRLDGGTSGEDRDLQMNDFNHPKSDKQVFILSTRAGGLGINLQAASVVILFDSDWNPQADLQAMDRAHRIGQKRPVTVYRFITDNTIEERMYHRAMKKLYLDALVVQQGNMAKRDDKLSTEEMRGMIKWGAAAIFKNEADDIENVDIDEVLAMGADKMTKLREQQEQTVQTSLKSFNLGVDEGNVYQFEGIDYTTKPTRNVYITGADIVPDKLEAELAKYGATTRVIVSPSLDKAMANFKEVTAAIKAFEALHGATIPDCSSAPLALQYGSQSTVVTTAMKAEVNKRIMEEEAERKRRAVAYREKLEAAEDQSELQAATSGKGPKLPIFKRHPAFQFFDEDRLEELHEIRCQAIVAKFNGDTDIVELTEEQQAEKEKLEAEGFGAWAYKDMMAFVGAVAEVGRGNHQEVAVRVGKTVEDVTRYDRVFWEKGPHTLERFELYRAKVEKAAASKKIGAKKRVILDTAFEKVPNIWSPFANSLPHSITAEVDGEAIPIKIPTQTVDRYTLAYSQQTDADYQLVRMRMETAPEIFFDLTRHRPDAKLFTQTRMAHNKIVKIKQKESKDDENQVQNQGKAKKRAAPQTGSAKKQKK